MTLGSNLGYTYRRNNFDWVRTTATASFYQQGLPSGMKFAPRGELGPHQGELCPLGECLPLLPQGWTLYCLKEWRCGQRISSTRDNFTPVPRGQLLPWGSKFAPRVEVKNGSLAFDKLKKKNFVANFRKFLIEKQLPKTYSWNVAQLRKNFSDKGCQIFLCTTHQNWEKFTKWSQNIPNGHEAYKMVVKCSKCPQNIPTLSIPRPSKNTQLGFLV
jgi:hypothetical protein